MSKVQTIAETLYNRGCNRRDFLKFCAKTATLMMLPTSMTPCIAETFAQKPRQSVIWLSFQECTGCTQSLSRAQTSTLEHLIFDLISLDYHHTLQAASGKAAESARQQAMTDNEGQYLLIVEGAIPSGNLGYSTIAGISNLDMLKEVATGAKAIMAIGTCAAYGGLPHAFPNPTGAQSVQELISDKPIINIPGCPPVPTVITGIIAHFLIFGEWPELDALKRPLVFFGRTLHDRCFRRAFYEQGLFAEQFDDIGVKKGWCLYKLGCKGPFTYNVCATVKWNGGVSFPIEAGHGCLGCSQPNFWDNNGFYQPLSSIAKKST